MSAFRLVVEEKRRIYPASGDAKDQEPREEWVAIHTASSEDKATLGEMLKAIADRMIVIVR